MGQVLYTADQMFDKTLFARRKVIAYSHPNKAVIIKIFKAGDRIGQVDSYIDVQGKIWWLIFGKPKFVVEHFHDAFDIPLLKQQGAKSIKEVAKIAEQKKYDDQSSISKVLQSISKTAENTADAIKNSSKVAEFLVPAAIGAAMIGLGLMVYKNSQKVSDKLISKI